MVGPARDARIVQFSKEFSVVSASCVAPDIGRHEGAQFRDGRGPPFKSGIISACTAIHGGGMVDLESWHCAYCGIGFGPQVVRRLCDRAEGNNRLKVATRQNLVVETVARGPNCHVVRRALSPLVF